MCNRTQSNGLGQEGPVGVGYTPCCVQQQHPQHFPIFFPPPPHSPSLPPSLHHYAAGYKTALQPLKQQVLLHKVSERSNTVPPFTCATDPVSKTSFDLVSTRFVFTCTLFVIRKKKMVAEIVV